MDLLHWNGAAYPEPIALEGRYVRLEPLSVERHEADLLYVAQEDGADERFRYLPERPPRDGDDFACWIAKAVQSKDPLFFAVVDKATGRAQGRQALMRIDTANGVIEIGNILWGPAIARTRIATEAFRLFASYVFDDLGYRRLEWKCNNNNIPSKKAAERFGFVFEGAFRHHMVVKGENRDTAWFSITATEWPRIALALKDWLDPINFDENGKQFRKLQDFR